MRFSFVTFFSLLALSSSTSAGSNGLIGLGRSPFQPLCCYSCLSSFWGLELPCTQQAQRPAQAIGSSPNCHSSSTVYLSSLAYCMQVNCAVDNIGSAEVQDCWSKVAGDGWKVSSLDDNLPHPIPTIELSYNAVALNEISLVNNQYYEDSRKTIQGYVKQESAHALYGVIILVVVVGFCFCIGALRLLNFYLPQMSLPPRLAWFLSKYISKPALIRSRHLKKLPGDLGYIPSRSLTLLITGYIALNIVLCVINYPAFNPDTWYISSRKRLASWIADRLGVLCFANIALAIMFSGRNTPFLWIMGGSRTGVLTFHRWVARVAAVQGIIHTVLYWINTSRTGYDMFTLASNIHALQFNDSYWTFGIVAVIALAFMVLVFSMLPVRVRWYEFFLMFHIGFAIVVLACLWYHVELRFRKAYGYEVWLYIAFAFSGFDRVMRLFRIAALNWKSWTDKTHPSSVVELLPGDEFVKVTVFPSMPWKFTAGQHCFLYFPTLGLNPFQSHPFSIVGWNRATNAGILPTDVQEAHSRPAAKDVQEGVAIEIPSDHAPNPESPIELQELSSIVQGPILAPSISFVLRPEQGLTRQLHKQLIHSTKKPVSRPLRVMIEGPYGATFKTAIRDADTIIAIAGGIGITSILGYLQDYLSSLEKDRRGKASRFLLFWSAKEESLITAVKSLLEPVDELRRKGVTISIVCTGIGEGRLNIGGVVSQEVESEENAKRKVCVVSCGPGGMADEVRAAVVNCIGKNGVEIELVEESFGW